MATTRQISPNQWAVKIHSDDDSEEITVEVKISRERAERIIAFERARMEALNPGEEITDPNNIGSGFGFLLDRYAATGR